MMNFFNYNLGFPFGMNNWFMPTFSFPNLFYNFQMPTFSMFNMSDMWLNSFNNSFFNFYNPTINPNTNFYPQIAQTSVFATKSKSDSKSNTDTFEKSSKKEKQKLNDYNAEKGERLANVALNRSVGWTGYCARYVKNSIQNAGLGSYKYGHAYQMKDILKNNSNFKEISTENVDVKDLPAGCVLVYGKGKEGYSKNYGHTEITTGDGRAVSDGITRNLYKKPSAIFIPV